MEEQSKSFVLPSQRRPMTDNVDVLRFFYVLSQATKISPAVVRDSLSRSAAPATVFDLGQLLRAERFPVEQDILQKVWAEFDAVLERHKKAGIEMLHIGHPAYPPSLRDIL